LAGIAISDRQVARLTEQVGDGLARARDDKAQKRRRRQLPAQVASAPAAVAVEVDGGRLAPRAEGQGPGVHEQGRKVLGLGVPRVPGTSAPAVAGGRVSRRGSGFQPARRSRRLET
jgi:hypothetical protein